MAQPQRPQGPPATGLPRPQRTPTPQNSITSRPLSPDTEELKLEIASMANVGLPQVIASIVGQVVGVKPVDRFGVLKAVHGAVEEMMRSAGLSPAGERSSPNSPPTTIDIRDVREAEFSPSPPINLSETPVGGSAAFSSAFHRVSPPSFTQLGSAVKKRVSVDRNFNIESSMSELEHSGVWKGRATSAGDTQRPALSISVAKSWREMGENARIPESPQVEYPFTPCSVARSEGNERQRTSELREEADSWPARVFGMLPLEYRQQMWEVLGDINQSLVQHFIDTQQYSSKGTMTKALVQWASRIVRKHEANKAKVSQGVADRFGEGVLDGQVVEDGVPRKVEFYDEAAPLPCPWETVHGLTTYENLEGKLWRKEEIEDLVNDCQLAVAVHSWGYRASVVVPIFCYTAELHHRAMWAVWTPSKGQATTWKESPVSLEEEWAAAGDRGRFEVAGRRVREALGLAKEVAWLKEVELDTTPRGLRVYKAESARRGAGGHSWAYAVRFTNVDRGSDNSPLSDVGLWLPPPEHAFEPGGVFAVGALPPSGVFEYCLARGAEERLSRPGWTIEPTMGQYERDIIAQCEAKQNQQKYDSRLWNTVSGLLSSIPKHDGTTDATLPHYSPIDLCTRRSTRDWETPRTAPHALSLELDNSEFSLDSEARPGSRWIEDWKVGNAAKALVTAKTPVRDDRTRPTPLEIGHALTVQQLTYEETDWMVALSASPGENRMICSTETEETCTLQQLNSPCTHQPFYHMNQAMRSLQFGNEPPVIDVGADKASAVNVEGRYSAIGAWAKRDRQNVLFERVDKGGPRSLETSYRRGGQAASSVRWNGTEFTAFEMGSEEGLKIPSGKVDVKLNTWLLPKLAPFIQTLDYALSSLGPRDPETASQAEPKRRLVDQRQSVRDSTYFNRSIFNKSVTNLHTEGGPLGVAVSRKNYRGISHVQLPRSVYSEGRVVRWGAFTSSSEDQGIATSFASEGTGSTVFTIQGATCLKIAPFSRFARERECLYLPNTLFRIVRSLSVEQQQILGKEGFQLMELREVDELEAACILVHGLLRRVRSRGAAVAVLQAEEAIRRDGMLDMSLMTPSDGAVAAGWRYMVRVEDDVDYAPAPVAASTDWVPVSDQAAAMMLFSDVEALPNAPRGIDIEKVPRVGAETSSLDPYRKGYHIGEQDSIVEIVLRRKTGDGKGHGGTRQVPCVGGAKGHVMMNIIEKALGWISWRTDAPQEHCYSSMAGSTRVKRNSGDELELSRSGRVSSPGSDNDEQSESTNLGKHLFTPSRPSSPLRDNFSSDTDSIRADQRRQRTSRRARRAPPRLSNIDTLHKESNWLDSQEGWMPDPMDRSPWYEMKLNEKTMIGGVKVRGHAVGNASIISFSAKYCREHGEWLDIQMGEVFHVDRSHERTTIRFIPPVYGNGVRIYPKTIEGSPIGFRIALLTASCQHGTNSCAFLFGPTRQDVTSGMIAIGMSTGQRSRNLFSRPRNGDDLPPLAPTPRGQCRWRCATAADAPASRWGCRGLMPSLPSSVSVLR
eukprot:Hpha_TRINITY_DN11155_c0_g1::TRINITY_DN11155_c0_g1_i2::g.27981::m.27981